MCTLFQTLPTVQNAARSLPLSGASLSAFDLPAFCIPCPRARACMHTCVHSVSHGRLEASFHLVSSLHQYCFADTLDLLDEIPC